MKKGLIIGIIIGGIIFGSIGVLAGTYIYHANQVSYTPSNNNFDVDNVESAINELYSKTGSEKIKGLAFIGFDYQNSKYFVRINFSDTNNTYEEHWNEYSNNTTTTYSNELFNAAIRWSVVNQKVCSFLTLTLKKSGYYLFVKSGNPASVEYKDADTILYSDHQLSSYVNALYPVAIVYLGNTNPFNE